MLPLNDASDLVRTSKFTRLTGFVFDEYKLGNRRPESFAALADAIARGPGMDGILWITSESFIHEKTTNLKSYNILPAHYQEISVDVEWGGSNEPMRHYLRLQSSSLEEAYKGLEYLISLTPDPSYEKWIFECNLGDFAVQRCHLPCHILEKILATPRTLAIHKKVLTPEHGRTLASYGMKTKIELCDCTFADGGTAFAKAFAKHEALGPAELTIRDQLPLKLNKFAAVLEQRKLNRLLLEGDFFLSEVVFSCIVASTPNLGLHRTLQPEEADCLIEAVRKGCGPKHLAITLPPTLTLTKEWFPSFLEALSGNTFLESLEITDSFHHGWIHFLPFALVENKGLLHLRLNVKFDKETLSDMLSAVSTHPSLRTLSFQVWEGDDTVSCDAVIQQIAVTLAWNHHLEDVHCKLLQDDKDWQKLIVPRLEYNRYQTRFQRIQETACPSIRTALIGKALLHVKSTPSLTFQLVSHSVDAILQFTSPNQR